MSAQSIRGDKLIWCARYHDYLTFSMSWHGGVNIGKPPPVPCSLGKNYLEHAKELGDAVPERPVLFLKPPSTAVLAAQQSQTPVRLPQNRCCVLLRLCNPMQAMYWVAD